MGENNTSTGNKEGSLLSSLLFRYIPYWPLFLSLLFVSVASAWIYLRFVTPMYAAAATILIKDEKRGADDSKIMEVLNSSTAKKIVENETEVIQSRDLMKEVVTRLHLYASVREKRNIKTAPAYTSSPIIIEAKEPGHLKEAEKVYFSYNATDNKVTIDNKSYLLNQWVSTPYGILKFTPNARKTTDSEGPLYFSLIQPQGVADYLLPNLKVNAVNKNSTVINLTFIDEAPQRAEDILNTLTEVYNQAALNEKNALAVNTITFLDNRMKDVEGSLDSIEKKTQRYRAQKGAIDISAQGQLFLQNVGDNDRKVADIGNQLAVLDQVEKYIVSKDNKAGIAPSSLGVNDPVLSQLLLRLSSSELEYEKLRQTVGDNNSVLASLKREIDQIRPSILENLRNTRVSLQASRGNINATNNMFSSMLRTLPQQERELTEITRQEAVKREVYAFLLQKREETALSYASSMVESRVVNKAQAYPGPVSPNRKIIYLASIVVALGLGIAIVSGKELLSTKILFRSEIENNTKVPIAAEISSVKHKHELIVDQPKNTFIAEQFRHLRAAIGLYGKKVLKKKLLITSSIAGEGKSFIASNLALSLAISGKKVVIVDADLRSPKTSSIFKLQNEKGMADYLEGKVEVSEIIKEGGTNNLYVIPAGAASINPTELLLNGNLKELFAYLEIIFDFVLIDTAPVDPVTDAYVLSQYCDRTLFVIRHDYTPKTMVQLLDENDKIKALRNPAIVFNGIKKRGFTKGGYGFGYGFGYEYVYAGHQDKKGGRTKTSLN